MSQPSDLIAGRSSDGVQSKSLDELGVLYGGLTGKSKTDFAEGDARFVSYVNIFNNLSTNVTPEDRVTVAEGERQNRVRYGDVLFTASSESADEVGMASGVTSEPPEPLYLNSFCFGFRPHNVDDLDPEFAKHLFRSLEVRKQIIRTSNGVTRINISKERFRGIKIPVPPLAIQRKIASILDKMESLKAELGAELDAELDLRSRQYAHYRDSLLTFAEGEVRWATLSEISTNLDSRRRPVTKDARVLGTIPYYGASGIVDYVSEYIFDGEYLLVSEDGANLLARSTAIAFSAIGQIWVNNHAHVLEFSNYVERRFVEIYLNSIDLSPYVTGAAQPKLNKANLNVIPIPVPRLAEQERIVAILDTFDALVNDLSIGLPAEIEARRQQYEYYRDRLLTFDEAVA